MGTKERKEREKTRRKDQILTAAIELIEQQGFEHTTMDEIANQAELSKGTLYLYFNDKSTLHQAIKKRGLSHLHDRFLQILQKDVSGADILKEMAVSFLNMVTKNVTFSKSMFIYQQVNEEKMEKNPIVEDCEHLQKELLMLMVRAIQIGIQDKSIKTTLAPKVLALTVSFQLSGILQFYLSGSKKNAKKILQGHELTITELMEQFLDIQFGQAP
jgi:AcrR family transcriptional regulator